MATRIYSDVVSMCQYVSLVISLRSLSKMRENLRSNRFLKLLRVAYVFGIIAACTFILNIRRFNNLMTEFEDS